MQPEPERFHVESFSASRAFTTWSRTRDATPGMRLPDCLGRQFGRIDPPYVCHARLFWRGHFWARADLHGQALRRLLIRLMNYTLRLSSSSVALRRAGAAATENP